MASVSEQRDSARREKDELRGKLENLEEALKVRNVRYSSVGNTLFEKHLLMAFITHNSKE